MRSEQEMLYLIVSTAANDDRIRAVIMTGSRANPNAPRDCFQDFDIVYIARKT
jgi:aminoglycoside 6-adenylyltransferase